MGADDRSEGDGFQTQKREGLRKDDILARAIVIDGRKEWVLPLLFGDECLGRRCKTDIPPVLQGKHTQAVLSTTGRRWSASSTELRELREEVRRLKSAGKKPAVQFEETKWKIC